MRVFISKGKFERKTAPLATEAAFLKNSLALAKSLQVSKKMA
jgi:hypothetical protein